jgi:hypothetical protein
MRWSAQQLLQSLLLPLMMTMTTKGMQLRATVRSKDSILALELELELALAPSLMP